MLDNATQISDLINSILVTVFSMPLIVFGLITLYKVTNELAVAAAEAKFVRKLGK